MNLSFSDLKLDQYIAISLTPGKIAFKAQIVDGDMENGFRIDSISPNFPVISFLSAGKQEILIENDFLDTPIPAAITLLTYQDGEERRFCR